VSAAGRNPQFRPWPERLRELFGVAAAGVLVAERFVEGMGIRTAVRCVEDHHLPASDARFFLERLHEELADAASAEALADDEAGYLAARLVALDEILDVEGSETRDFPVQLGDDEPGRRIVGDALDPLRGLLWTRGVAQLAEKRGDRRRVAGLGFA
jgi:hypothetical protein